MHKHRRMGPFVQWGGGGGGGGGGNTFWPVLHGITNPYARTGAQGGGGGQTPPLDPETNDLFLLVREVGTRTPLPRTYMENLKGEKMVSDFPPPPPHTFKGWCGITACVHYTPRSTKKKNPIYIRTPLCPNPRRVWGGGGGGRGDSSIIFPRAPEIFCFSLPVSQ